MNLNKILKVPKAESTTTRILLTVVLVALCASITHVRFDESSAAQKLNLPHPSKDDQRGTDNSPLVVKVLPSPKTDTEVVQEKEERVAKTTVDWWMIKLTGAMVLVALLQLSAFIWQATTLGRTVTVMRDTAQRQLRAYVSVHGSQITGINAGQTPVATLFIKNYGQTPAYAVNQMGGIALGVSFTALPPPTGSEAKSIAPLGPGAHDEPPHTAPQPLTATASAALVAGTLTLWVYGTIRYRDAFNIEHFTKYRLMVGGHVGVSGNKLAICEEGNEAD